MDAHLGQITVIPADHLHAPPNFRVGFAEDRLGISRVVALEITQPRLLVSGILFGAEWQHMMPIVEAGVLQVFDTRPVRRILRERPQCDGIDGGGDLIIKSYRLLIAVGDNIDLCLRRVLVHHADPVMAEAHSEIARVRVSPSAWMASICERGKSR